MTNGQMGRRVSGREIDTVEKAPEELHFDSILEVNPVYRAVGAGL